MLSKGFGGGERYFVDLALALARGGHEVQAIVHRKFNSIGFLSGEAGLQVDLISSLGMWDRLALRRLIRTVSEFSPQIMHSHMARAAWAGGKAVPSTGVPLVATTHNYVDLKYYRHVARFVPTTEDQERYLLAEGVEPSRIARIPNFSMLAPVSAPAPIPDRPIRFAAFGRFVPKKGYAVLLEAFAKALADGLGPATLALGGDGPLRRDLEQRSAALGLSEQVRFDGWIDDIGGYLDRADVFVLPSLDEPFGIVMLEAMARGRPIVTTRTQGPSEVLDDKCAYFAEIGDSGTLASALVRVAAEPDRARARAAEALGRYRKLYHCDAVVPQILALYGATVAAH